MFSLRKAEITDVPILKYWDTKPHVQFATGNDDAIDWELEIRNQDQYNQHYIAEMNGAIPIAAIQIIDPLNESTHYWGEIEPNLRAIDIWIGEEAHLGKGYGTEIMKLVIKKCFDDREVKAILIDPLLKNVRAIKFYKSLGFKEVEVRVFGEEDECMVMRRDRY